MSDNLYSVWSFSTKVKSITTVVPDGCRDLIMKMEGKERPQWFVSPLFDQSQSVLVEENSTLVGFRMRPGVEISENELLGFIEHSSTYVDEVQSLLDDFTSIDCSVDEALECLASDINSIKQASLRLGVSSRTLQRLILNKTGRTPGYWFQLARVRKAAMCITRSVCFSEAAEICGFSDQSHMNREFQRWFKTSPSEILKSPDIIDQLNDIGYG
ncbi:MAG: helix-turn-helix domain-containing protein [Gammaproteobacteria bacterium]|nr:helix-turn-helix domain-containing protein [Gammaproteobacteria bacterium]